MSNTINYVPAPDSVLLMARTIEEKIGAIFKPTQALEKELAKANQEFFQILKIGEACKTYKEGDEVLLDSVPKEMRIDNKLYWQCREYQIAGKRETKTDTKYSGKSFEDSAFNTSKFERPIGQ